MPRHRHNQGLQSRQIGADYTDDDLELFRAMQAYMWINHCRFPAFTEVLAVIVSLGYRKVAPPGPIPRRKE